MSLEVKMLILLGLGVLIPVVGIWLLRKWIRHKKRWGILTVVFLVLMSYWSINFFLNVRAYIAKVSIENSLQAHIKDIGVNISSEDITDIMGSYVRDNKFSGRLSLANMGDTKWDYACAAGGVDYTRTTGKDAAQSSLRGLNIDFSKFSKADTVLHDKENGLVFINLSQKVLVFIPVERRLARVASEAIRKRYGMCMPAENAYLFTATVHKGNDRKYLVLTYIEGV